MRHFSITVGRRQVLTVSPQIRAVLPVQVFLPPNQYDRSSARAASTGGMTGGLEDPAPPLYGNHQFDQLWSEIDLSGYMTPAYSASGAATPLQPPSRSTSLDNLSSLDAVSQRSPGPITPQALQHRLADMPEPQASRWRASYAGFSTPPRASGPARGHSEDSGPPAAEPTSAAEAAAPAAVDDDGNPESQQPWGESPFDSPLSPPLHIEFDAETLSKVPSYHTAVRAPARVPFNGDLPNYETATGSPRRICR